MNKVLIFGGTSAIAEEYAQLILSNGGQVFLVGRNTNTLTRTAKDLEIRSGSSPDTVHTLAINFTNYDEIKNCFNQADKTLQGISKVLVAHGCLPEQEELQNDFSAAINSHHVNYLSAVAVCESAAQYFLEKAISGQISVISSVAGDRGRKSNYFYGASKGALSLYLQGLRGRLHSSEITVLTVKPGFVDTPMTSHLEKGLLWAKPASIAAGILRAEETKRNIVYLPFYWFSIMLCIKLIPECIFKKLSI